MANGPPLFFPFWPGLPPHLWMACFCATSESSSGYTVRKTMSSPAQKPLAGPEVQAPDILPTLFGAGYGTYAVRRGTFLISFLLHTLGIILFLVLSIYMVSHQ